MVGRNQSLRLLWRALYDRFGNGDGLLRIHKRPDQFFLDLAPRETPINSGAFPELIRGIYSSPNVHLNRLEMTKRVLPRKH